MKHHHQGLGPGHALDQDHGQGLEVDLHLGQDPEAVDEEIENPGNTLYVTGLSTRVTQEQLQDHFSKEGKVANCFLVVEPRSRISRGFAFITMETVEDANRCIKHLNQSVLEHRQITVERLCWQQSKLSSSMQTLKRLDLNGQLKQHQSFHMHI
ncbi:putative RNA recognition motif domain, nucleotide-binding alpha-beta plait domain superfamily [Helianthus anomalus]